MEGNGPDNRYEVRDPDIEARMIFLAKGIAQGLPDTWGFALFLCEKGEGNNLFYVSSIERTEVMELLKEWIIRNTV